MGRQKQPKIEITATQNTEQPIVSPSQVRVTPSTQHKELAAPEPTEFQPFPGEYHLVRLAPDGAEIPGSDFSVGASTYNKTYSKLTNYKVKKNPK